MENDNFLPDTYKTPASGCLTINTDASHCRQTLAAGWAFWAVCDQFTFKKADAFRDICANPNEAESKCIANAVDLLLKRADLPKVRYIIINTDSKGSIAKIGKAKEPAPKLVAELLEKLQAATGAGRVEFRHVKAHSGKGDARSKVNKWCDTHAKKYMILKRNEINKNKKCTK